MNLKMTDAIQVNIESQNPIYFLDFKSLDFQGWKSFDTWDFLLIIIIVIKINVASKYSSSHNIQLHNSDIIIEYLRLILYGQEIYKMEIDVEQIENFSRRHQQEQSRCSRRRRRRRQSQKRRRRQQKKKKGRETGEEREKITWEGDFVPICQPFNHILPLFFYSTHFQTHILYFNHTF